MAGPGSGNRPAIERRRPYRPARSCYEQCRQVLLSCFNLYHLSCLLIAVFFIVYFLILYFLTIKLDLPRPIHRKPVSYLPYPTRVVFRVLAT
ncbi:putative sulfated surface glycoprotein 185-like [Iris pallida]|uniref:Sulfated surface glycoprotein 185-like n=1 Tax=Iris pallida TaxID=29817 RepID=A0AAX6HWI2_IRIPA|nr:putative sulfated surface glycoprotein 185-like [Iris pallida]